MAGFFGRPPGLIFGALVPKGNYLNVSLLWRGSATNAIQQFYNAQEESLRRFFPATPESLCGCNPRILIGPATTYYGDRWVAVGDAVVSHLYKDGINSAFLTSRAAMTTAVGLGIGEEDFRRGYEPLCNRMAADNRYGAFLYSALGQLLNSSLFAVAFAESVRAEAALSAERQLHARLLWGMLTGDETYRSLFRLVLKPKGVFAFSRQLLRAVVGTSRGER